MTQPEGVNLAGEKSASALSTVFLLVDLMRIVGFSSYNLGIGARHIISRQSASPSAEAMDYWWRRRFYSKRMRWN